MAYIIVSFQMYKSFPFADILHLDASVGYERLWLQSVCAFRYFLFRLLHRIWSSRVISWIKKYHAWILLLEQIKLCRNNIITRSTENRIKITWWIFLTYCKVKLSWSLITNIITCSYLNFLRKKFLINIWGCLSGIKWILKAYEYFQQLDIFFQKINWNFYMCTCIEILNTLLFLKK